MKILLVNPNFNAGSISVNLGVNSIATYLNAFTAHRAVAIDFGFQGTGDRRWRSHLARAIAREQPDAYGISISSPFAGRAKLIVREIRKLSDRPVLAGGWHPTISPEETLHEVGADVVGLGDGEDTVADWLDALQNGTDWADVAGLYFLRDGRIVRTKARPLLQNLEMIPPLDWDLCEMPELLQTFRSVSFVASRGCPFKCSFCAEHILGSLYERHFRLHDPKHFVAKMVHQYRKYAGKGFDFAWIWDPVFTANVKWLRDFSKAYREAGLHERLPYAVYARADQLGEERVRCLAESGCIKVRIGVESGDEEMRSKILNKPLDQELIKEAIRRCQRHGIHATCFFILGAPGETRRSLRNTWNFVRELDIDFPMFFLFKPFPKLHILDRMPEVGAFVEREFGDMAPDIRFDAQVNTGELSVKKLNWYHFKFLAFFMGRIILREIRDFRLRYFTMLLRDVMAARRNGVPGLVNMFGNWTYVTELTRYAIRNRERWPLWRSSHLGEEPPPPLSDSRYALAGLPPPRPYAGSSQDALEVEAPLPESLGA